MRICLNLTEFLNDGDLLPRSGGFMQSPNVHMSDHLCSPCYSEGLFEGASIGVQIRSRGPSLAFRFAGVHKVHTCIAQKEPSADRR